VCKKVIGDTSTIDYFFDYVTPSVSKSTEAESQPPVDFIENK